MADISFYKYLAAAFRYKLFDPKGQRANFDTRYNYLGYNLTYKQLFFYARRVLPKFYRGEFPDTEEGNLQMAKTFLQKLDKHQDPELEKYFNPATAPAENESVIAEAVKESQAVPAGVSTGGENLATMTGGQLPQTPRIVVPTIPRPQVPPAFTNAFKNTSSSAQRSFYRNIGSKINPTSAINGLSNLLGTVAKGAGSAIGGSLSASTPFLSRAGNGLINAGSRLTSQTSRLGGPRLISPNRRVWIGAVALFGLFFGFSLIAGIISPNTTTTSEASPSSNGLNYTLPLKNPTIQPIDIRDQIKAAFPSSKLEYWNTIIDTTRSAGINPALALALWIEETGASQATLIKNGGSEIITNGSLSKGHLGCAPLEDQTISESLNCLIKFINNNNFTNNDFPQFMAKYSGGPVSDPFSNNPNFITNFRSWYSKLVPSGAGALTNITPQLSYTPNGGAGIVSCPLNGVATITLGSKDAGGHCTPQYQAQEASCLNPDVTGRSTAIDVQSSDKAVFLPTLGGQTAEWTIDTTGAISEGGVYVGQDLAATSSYNGKTYRIRFVHLDSTQLKIISHYPSGTFVGLYRTAQNHVHITLQADSVFKPADLYFNLCR